MKSFLRYLLQRWENWVGDRDMEQAIRAHLSANGYYGRTARIERVKLVAVRRPGWVQIYRFEVTARVAAGTGEGAELAPQEDRLYGLVLDDGRARSRVRVFKGVEQRRDLFAQWSEGMICLRGAAGLT